MNGKVRVVFNRNCFPKMKHHSRLRPPPKGSNLHRKCGSRPINKMVQDRHTANRKYHMVYRFVPSTMTLDDLKVICQLQDLSNAIQRTYVRHFARFQVTRRVDDS